MRTKEGFVNSAVRLGFDKEKIDIESYFDPNLTLSENLNILKQFKPDVPNVKSMALEYEDHINEQIEKHNESIKTDLNLAEHYSDMNRALDKLKHGFANIVLIKGRAGVGKTYGIRAFLNSHNIEFVIAKKITPAYFYRFLFENNGKLIWLQDVMRIFNDRELKEVIKAVGEFEPENRIITNYSYSYETQDLPKHFICTSKFIFDYNTENINQLKYKEDFLAIMSRAEYVELVFDFKEMSDVMRKICKTQEEKDITEFLIKNYKFVGLNHFNLRTQQKAFKTYLWARKTNRNWKTELKGELTMNLTPVRAFLYQFMGKTAIRMIDLKRMLLSSGYVNTMRTAERKITNWIELGELYKTLEERNAFVSLFPMGSINDTPLTTNLEG